MYEDDRRYAKQLKYIIQKVTTPPANNKVTLPSGTQVNHKFRLTLVNPDGQRSEHQL